MLSVILLFRKPNPAQHSVERVFSQVTAWFSSKTDAHIVALPHSNAGLMNKVKNIVWMRKVSGNIHVTGDVYYAVALKRCKIIATVHDIGILSEVTRVKKWIIKYIWFDRLAQKAGKLIFISNHARNDFLTRVSADINKTRVIYNPLPAGFKYVPREFDKGRPAILHIGTKKNKNLPRLAVSLKGLDCILVIIGALTDDQKHSLEQNNIRYINKTGLDHDEITRQYEEADMLVFASIHEGFGMPIIEAQAVGRPVVTSNISSMPEVAGEGACFVDPYDPADIRRGILQVWNDDEYRNQLIQKGLENTKRFDPSLVAAQYLEVYREVFGNG